MGGKTFGRLAVEGTFPIAMVWELNNQKFLRVCDHVTALGGGVHVAHISR